MNDRLGGTTTSLDGGNIRYYGANPSNYIDIGEGTSTMGKWQELGAPFNSVEECLNYFNCSTNYSNIGFSSEEECNNNLPQTLQEQFGMTIEEFNNTYCVIADVPKLWRIIGLFKDATLSDGTKKDLIKVIRNESIGSYSWDTSEASVNSGYGINEWSQADAMKLLNPGYENESIGGSLWYNSKSGTCYSGGNNATKTCDFTSTGLPDNVKSKIATVVWNTGGFSSSQIYSNEAYVYERGTNVVIPGKTCSGTLCNDGITRNTIWIGKVGLMYPSDYGYGVDFNSCTQNLYSYWDSNCQTNHWFSEFYYKLLLTPDSSCAYGAWLAGNAIDAIGGGISSAKLHPVFYLDSDVSIESDGDGTKDNPYRIS